MPLATALDGLSFQLASAYTAGAGQLQLTSGAGTSIQASLTRQGASAISSTAPIYVVLVPKANFSSSGLVSSFTNCVQYKVTGLSSNTLTGVTALYSGTDRNFASGDVVVFGTLSQYINDTNTILGQIRARDIKADDGYSFVWNTGNNVLIGQNAGAYNYTNGGGYSNVGVGDNALAANTTGTRNTAVGVYAAQVITTGSYNTCIGQRAFPALTTGTGNVGVSYHALFGCTTGSYNTGVGYSAGTTITTESYNTCLGYGADTTAGNAYSTAIGWNAKTTASNQVRLGTATETVSIPGALAVAGTATLSGGAVVVAASASGTGLIVRLAATPTGPAIDVRSSADASLFRWTASGIFYIGGYANFQTGAAGNVFVGNNSAPGVAAGTSTASESVGVGDGALLGITTGVRNTSIGTYSMLAATTGSRNCALGHRAMSACTTGSDNTGVGRFALPNLTTGALNVAFGQSAGSGITTESNNTCIGSATVIGAGHTNSTAIGYGATTTASNQIRLGTAAETVSIPGALAVTGAVTLSSGLILPTLADSSAANGTIYLSSTNTDGAGAPKLCRKSAAGTVTVIG